MSDEATFLASLNSFLAQHVPGTQFVAAPASATSPARYSLRGIDGQPVPLSAGQRDQIIEALGRRGVPPHTIVPTEQGGQARMSILQDGRMKVDGLDYHGVRQNGVYPTVQNLPPENWRMGVLNQQRLDAIERMAAPQRQPNAIHETPSQYERPIARGQVQPAPAQQHSPDPHARQPQAPNRYGRYSALVMPVVAAASMLFGDNANAATGRGPQDERPTNAGDFFRIIGGQHPSNETGLGRTINTGYERFNHFMNNTVRETINDTAQRVVDAVTPPPRPPAGPKP